MKQNLLDKISKKEALIGVGIVIFNFLWWFGFAYGLGSGDPEDYTYIMGFPSWFFYSCITGFVVVTLLVYTCVKTLFTDIPFEEGDKEE
ncbi:MAG: YhdT family protein [Bacillus sp. (in: firmicutes)]